MRKSRESGLFLLPDRKTPRIDKNADFWYKAWSFETPAAGTAENLDMRKITVVHMADSENPLSYTIFVSDGGNLSYFVEEALSSCLGRDVKGYCDDDIDRIGELKTPPACIMVSLELSVPVAKYEEIYRTLRRFFPVTPIV